MPVDPSSVPDYDDLPIAKEIDRAASWGLFDQDGVKDKFGTLNFLTPEIVKAAAKEVTDGISISLNWPINALAKLPLSFRKAPKHNVIDLSKHVSADPTQKAIAWDDELEFNTQASSQWDSLCHFPHQGTGYTYNAAKTELEAFTIETTAENQMPTLDHWHDRGGVVARGVLIDFKEYAEQKGITFNAFAGYRITVKEIEEVAAYQGVEIRPGDVLIVRTGATEVLEAVSKNPALMKKDSVEFAGVHGVEETVRWLWNKRIAAVAGDAIAFEAFPPLKPDGTPGSASDLYLHEALLAVLGMPIGELWDLARLSKYSKEKKRYSFLLTSTPLNHPGLVGSPPNALAIF